MDASDLDPCRSSLEVLGVLGRALAGCDPDVRGLFRCTAEHLNGSGFGYERVALFKGGTGRFDAVPAAQHGFDDLEVLHGQLPPLDGWPLFQRALRRQQAVWAQDAQLNGDIPLEVAGALQLQSIIGMPFISNGHCLGFALVDHGGGAFQLQDGELELLTTAAQFIAAALVGAMATEQARRTSDLKTQFVALASHELRAPVAGIHGVTSTLRDRGKDLMPEQLELLQRTMFEQSDRMRRLVDQLLDLTKLEAESVTIRPARFGVRERVESLIRQLVPDKVPFIELDVTDGLETVADPDAFDRIVGNLVTNAFRYGAPPVRVAAQQLDTHFRLWVEDNGDGVAPEFAPKLFERFARGRPDANDGGSGLGLAIAQSYAQAQGGRLLYEGGFPKGARFQLVLPTRDS